MKTWAVLAPFPPAFTDAHRHYLKAPTQQHPGRVVPSVLNADDTDWGKVGVYGSALHDVALQAANEFPGAQVVPVDSPMWPADSDIAHAFRISREAAALSVMQ